MEDTEIKKLLRVQKQSGERGWRCPDEIQLAAYVTKRLDSSARSSVESHIADCDFCLSQVLTRKPANTVNWGGRWISATAAVACLILLAVVVVVQLRRRETVSPSNGPFIAEKIEPPPVASPQFASTPPALRPEPSPATQVPKAKSTRTGEVRSMTPKEIIPRLLSPKEGAAVRWEDLELRWQPVSDTIFYEIRLMSASGDVVFAQQTENTSLKPGIAGSLVPGTKYFIIVSAHLREGKTIKSGVVSFRLTE